MNYKTLIEEDLVAHVSLDYRPMAEISSAVWRSLVLIPHWPLTPESMKIYGARQPDILVRSNRGYPFDRLRDHSEACPDNGRGKLNPELFHVVVKRIALKATDVIRLWPQRISKKRIQEQLNSPRRRAGRMFVKLSETLPSLTVRGGGSIASSPGPYTVPKIARRVIAFWAEQGDPTAYDQRTVERALHRYYQRQSADLMNQLRQ